MMIEAAAVAGYVIAWAVRKARRAAGRLDVTTDAALDAGLDKLHTAVLAKLDRHPALDDLAEEAAGEDGQVTELTRQQVELAITAAARRDDTFGQAVTDLIAQLRAVERTAGLSVVAGAGSVVFGGDAHAHAEGSGVAIGQAGAVHIDGPGEAQERRDPSGPGR